MCTIGLQKVGRGIMINYTHEFIEELRVKAQQYCEAYVFDWQSSSDEQKQWYVETTLRLLCEDEAFSQRVFSKMLN